MSSLNFKPFKSNYTSPPIINPSPEEQLFSMMYSIAKKYLYEQNIYEYIKIVYVDYNSNNLLNSDSMTNILSVLIPSYKFISLNNNISINPYSILFVDDILFTNYLPSIIVILLGKLTPKHNSILTNIMSIITEEIYIEDKIYTIIIDKIPRLNPLPPSTNFDDIVYFTLNNYNQHFSIPKSSTLITHQDDINVSSTLITHQDDIDLLAPKEWVKQLKIACLI